MKYVLELPVCQIPSFLEITMNFLKKKSFQFFNLFKIDSNKHCSDFFTFELLFNYFKWPVL